MRRCRALVILAILSLCHLALGQLDPDKRELVQLGFNQALEGASPFQGYGYYYINEPNFFRTNVTLRLAFAGVYLDSETGFVGLLGPNTDLGFGLSGGGFEDSYFEFHDGKYLPDESFFGHSVESTISIYHLFDPGRLIPLSGVLRVKEHYSIYDRDDTSPDFTLPNNHLTTEWRAGLRLGGREPIMTPDMAMELSVWYDGQYRTGSGPYGFDGDRELNEESHLFWGRALLVYTFPKSKQAVDISLTGGTSVDADRFSAYRLGGNLPMISEFPLLIPGYFNEELSARSFVCFTSQYTFPLDPDKRWSLSPIGSVATMDYLPGMEQPGHFNSGAGVGLGYRPRSGLWQVLATYGYGFEAIRSDGRGGQAVGIFCQIDLESRHPRSSELEEGINFLREHF
jgi:hypothetical protein